MSKLWQARFFTTVNHIKDLPKFDVPEVAFVGRSNAGKSSSINILCNQKKLAFSSKTPGRTQHINFFSIGGAHVAQHRKDPVKTDEIEMFLVDLPGYGYAQVSGDAKNHWQNLLGEYLMTREQLRGVILVMDARHPFQSLDVELLEWFARTGKPVHCLLTKVDKLTQRESSQALKQTQTILSSYIDQTGQSFPFTCQLFSSIKRKGLDEASMSIFKMAEIFPEKEKNI